MDLIREKLNFFSRICKVGILEEKIEEIQEDLDRVIKFLSLEDFADITTVVDSPCVLEDPCLLSYFTRKDEVEKSSEDFHKRLREISPFQEDGYISCV